MTLQEAVYTPVERLYKLATDLNDENYTSSANFEAQLDRAEELAELAGTLAEVYARLVDALSVEA